MRARITRALGLMRTVPVPVAVDRSLRRRLYVGLLEISWSPATWMLLTHEYLTPNLSKHLLATLPSSRPCKDTVLYSCTVRTVQLCEAFDWDGALIYLMTGAVAVVSLMHGRTL